MEVLNQINAYKKLLPEQSPQEVNDFLAQLGYKLQVARRHEITEKHIFEIEELLAELFINLKRDQQQPQTLIDTVANVRSYAYDLGNHIETKEKLNMTFFEKVYELGKKLENLAELIGALILPILLSNNLPWG